MNTQAQTQAATVAVLNNIDKANSAMVQPIRATVINAAGEQTIVKGKRNTKQDKAATAAFANMTKATSNTMVTTGGTNAEPEKADAASFATVTMAELGTSGSVLQNLAFNFLAGNVDKSITVDTLNQLPRALRNEKTAIKGLLGKKASDIRAAWEREQSQRKRLDTPTLRALWSAAKGKQAKGTGETWKDKVVKILDGKQSAAMKLQMLRELVDETK